MHFSVEILRLMLSFFLFTMRSTLRFLNSKREKTSKSGNFEILPSWYYIIITKGKGDCKNLIHFSSVSCLFKSFNLDDEFGSYIIFSNWSN